ncbi:MAG: hypothetical protein O2894_09430 [Planctomycetota bacterium]|nr:hypothetical protein [Planctomycetota bacterium]
MPSEPPETVFKFTAEGVDLEFAGSEAFVERQVTRFRSFLENAVGLVQGTPAAPAGTVQPAAPAATGAVTAAAAPTAEPATFTDFLVGHPPRGGRGAIQDRILLAIYFMNVVRKQREVGADDVLYCFKQASWEKPKNLHNALGVLKRNVGHLQEGSRRGLYQLSPVGLKYMDGRYSG